MQKEYDGNYSLVEPIDIATDGPAFNEALAEYWRLTTAAEIAERKASIGFNEDWEKTLMIDTYGPENRWADELMDQSWDIQKGLYEARERANEASEFAARIRETAGTTCAALDEAERKADDARLVYTAYLGVLQSICKVAGFDGDKTRAWVERYGRGKSPGEVARLLKSSEKRIRYLTEGVYPQRDFCMAIGKLNNAYAQSYDYNDDID